MAVITTALATGTALTGTIIAAGVGTGLATAGSIGQAYSAKKAADLEKSRANIQNAMERKKVLRSMRMSAAALEAQGVASNTTGATSQVGATAAVASSAAGAIGYQGTMTDISNKISKINSMAAGFGTLSQVGSSIYSNKEVVGGMFNKKKSNPTLKPTAATINTGAEFIGYT